MRGVSGNRLAWGILGIVVLMASAVGLTLAATAGPAPAAGSSAGATSSHPGRGGAAGAPGAVGSIGAVNRGSVAAAAPALGWCCTAGSPLGLTATGQAVVPGASTAARSAAITKATADAVTQARAAAQGAGISLGRIINIDVSGPSYPYPLPLGAAARAGTPGSTTIASTGSGTASPGGPGRACPVGVPCPYPGVSAYATVTITWAIG
jgi:hypothetical protein